METKGREMDRRVFLTAGADQGSRANLDDNDVFTALMALNSLDYLDQRAESALPAIRALPLTQDGMLRQFESYVPRLVERILTDFER